MASSRLPCPLADLSDDSDDDMASSSSRSAGITSSPPLGGRRSVHAQIDLWVEWHTTEVGVLLDVRM